MADLKSLVNEVEDAVPETLSGLCSTYPQLEYYMSHKIVFSPDCRDRKDKVSLICGGGSGHEPFSAGFVGTGMLTASISGSIFAAPPSKHISYAINCIAAKNKGGILMIIPNYTGDCLNFGIALEKARQAGIKIEGINVGEDCSIPDKELSAIGKRGLSGMLFIIKIIGALAERGLPLHDVAKTAEIVLKNMATYGIGLKACSIPGQGLMFELPEDELEYGMGIHGEAGYEKNKMGKASEVVLLMLKRICSALSLANGDVVAVIVNNFGALSQLEQGIVVHEVVKQLNMFGIRPLRVYSGVLITSLNSVGIHITLLKLPTSHKVTFVSCLDDTTNAPAWPGCAYSLPLITPPPLFKEEEKKKMQKVGMPLDTKKQKLIKLCIKNACTAIIEKEAHLNELDRLCGDGDCGSTLKRLAVGIQQSLDNFTFQYPTLLFSELADIAEEKMGGASGALYCLFFTTAAKELSLLKNKEEFSYVWGRAFRNGIECMMKYGKAQIGDRTMLDVMDTAYKTYENLMNTFPNNIFEEVATAAWQGCEATKNMKPRAGRASYIKQEQYLKEVDAGAYAAATWISTIAKTITNFEE